MSDWGKPVVGAVPRFSGRVTSIDQVGGAVAQLTAAAWTILLNVNMPTNLYQAGCLHTVYDAGCGLDPNVFALSGTVSGSTPTQTSFARSLSGQNGDFAQCKLVFTTGGNAGLPRAIFATGKAPAGY